MEPATLPTVTEAHGLLPEQVTELRNAVDELDAFMVQSVDDRRRGRWVRPETKDLVDFRVRGLLRAVAHTFQVKPINEAIRLARTALLTRRVRVVMRAFNRNRRYGINVPPRIEWDDTFVPPDLYPDLSTVQEPGDTEVTADKGKGREERREEPMAVDKGKGRERPGDEREEQLPPVVDKGKGKERPTDWIATAQKKTRTDGPDDATKQRPKKKRKVVSPETIENSEDEWIPVAAGPPPPAPGRRPPAAKPVRNKRKPTTIPMVDVGSPPPCTRCVLYKVTCRHNGWKAACQVCSEARQKCSLSKAVPIEDTPSPVAGPSNPQPPTVVKIVIPRSLPAPPVPPTVDPQSPSPPQSQPGSRLSPQPAEHIPSPRSAQEPQEAPAATRRISPAVPSEPRVPKATTSARPHPDLDAMWERLQDQERRIREVEASDIAIRGIMVTKDKLKETDRAVRRSFQAVADELDCKTSRIEKKVNSCADDDVKAILNKLVDLGEQVDKVGGILDGQDVIMREELQSAERRWERQLNEQEQRLEGKIDDQEIRFQDGLKDNAFNMQTLAVKVEDALTKMTEDISKAPWEHQLAEAAITRRKELQDALKDRPTTGDLSAYTTLSMTEKIVTQLSNLQVRADEQYNGLQGGLNTLERLYLRQLDQTADMANVPQQLQGYLNAQQAEDRTRPPVVPRVPLFHQRPSNWAPSGRVFKGLPRRARATSGPPDSPSRPGPSTIPVSHPAEKEDVEMNDGGAGEGGPGMEMQENAVQLPPFKRARSIPPKSSIPAQAFLPRRTRSQSRSAVPQRIPFLHPPPTISEYHVAPGNSSPLSEPEDVAGLKMSDILQDHVL